MVTSYSAPGHEKDGNADKRNEKWYYLAEYQVPQLQNIQRADWSFLEQALLSPLLHMEYWHGLLSRKCKTIPVVSGCCLRFIALQSQNCTFSSREVHRAQEPQGDRPTPWLREDSMHLLDYMHLQRPLPLKNCNTLAPSSPR